MSPVRRVRRVIRKIDPWTVLKVSLVFNAIASLAFVLGSVMFWSVFVNAGIPDKITDLAEQLTLSFEADGPTYFRVVLLLSIIWAVLMTGLATLSALLYNLISDIVGGIEVVVLEETLAIPQTTAETRPVRKALFRRKPKPVAAEPAPAGKPKTPRRPLEPAPGTPTAPEPAARPAASAPAAPPRPAAVADLPTDESASAASVNGEVALVETVEAAREARAGASSRSRSPD